jgi:hypothetical protein
MLRDECPQCNNMHLHFSSDFEKMVCLYCGWSEGDNYTYAPKPIDIVEYLALIPILRKQLRMGTLNWHVYYDIFEFHLKIKDKYNVCDWSWGNKTDRLSFTDKGDLNDK